ncbi:MAG: FAD-dependent monooxygenase [Pseudomonadota bacterium]
MITTEYDFVVVGTGVIGATAALKLARSKPNLRIACVERQPPLSPPQEKNLKVFALGHLATEMLDDIGVLAQLEDECLYPYRSMYVWDMASVGELEFGLDDADGKENGRDYLGQMVDGFALQYLLEQALVAQRNVDVYFEHTVESFSYRNNVSYLQVSDTEELAAPLCLAADGASSALRALAKIGVHTESYQQLGLVAKIGVELGHQDTAWQRFLSAGPVALLPLANNQCSIVWSLPNDEAERLLQVGEAQFCDELSFAVGDKFGALSLQSKRVAFPLLSQRAESYYAPGLALLGDAAHVIHPLAGQGANLGFKDVKCMLSLIEHAVDGNYADLKILAKYERIRKSDNELTDRSMTLLHNAFTEQNSLWSATRGLGMNLVNRFALAKRMLAQQAIGF